MIYESYRACCLKCKRFMQNRLAEECDRCGGPVVQRMSSSYIPPDATDEQIAEHRARWLGKAGA